MYCRNTWMVPLTSVSWWILKYALLLLDISDEEKCFQIRTEFLPLMILKRFRAVRCPPLSPINQRKWWVNFKFLMTNQFSASFPWICHPVSLFVIYLLTRTFLCAPWEQLKMLNRTWCCDIVTPGTDTQTWVAVVWIGRHCYYIDFFLLFRFTWNVHTLFFFFFNAV